MIVWIAQGLRFIGEHADGKPHGIGRLYNTDGKLIFHGQFDNGQPAGVGVHYKSKDGAGKLEAKRMDKPNAIGAGSGHHSGSGTVTHDDGSSFSGNFIIA